MMFHMYGFFIGLALISGYLVVEQFVASLRNTASSRLLPLLTLGACVGGVIGARLYHVVTDWSLYRGQPFWSIFEVWHGGLGIWGALFGGLIGVLFVLWWKKALSSLLFWLDCIALALPLSQAIGRWGNFFNQELYGMPTFLPWAQRITVVSPATTPVLYHPLFLYESIPLLLFWIVICWWGVKKFRSGSGVLFGLYLLFYAQLRFWLDFLRINPTMIGLLTVAQWVSVGAFVVGVALIIRSQYQKMMTTTVLRTIVRVLTMFHLFLALFVIVNVIYTPQFVTLLFPPSIKTPYSYVIQRVFRPEELEKGLGGRRQDDGNGMLFVLGSRRVPTFWMKDMRFALDFLWLEEQSNGEFRIADITEHVPPTPPYILRQPKVPVTHVLEVPAGFAAKYSLSIGDSLNIR